MTRWLVRALGLLAVALLVVALFGPWWAAHSEFPGGIGPTAADSGMGIFGVTSTQQTPSGPETTFSNYSYLPDAAAVLGATGALTVTAALLGAGFVALSVVRRSKPAILLTQALLGGAASVVTLIAVVYPAAALPAAVNQDMSAIIGVHGMARIYYSGFWGSQTLSTRFGTEVITYGAGWAWYAVLAAGILFLAGGVLVLRERVTAPST